jgi:GNAT superfamily N-acetyltransferase
MNERGCTVTKHLEIVRAGLAEYNYLGRFHYRQSPAGLPGPHVAIYAMKDMYPARRRFAPVVGVIVYTMPTAHVELRNVATGGLFCGFGDRRLQLQLVNKYIRRIARVIIEPRYRGLGLASRLVAETMPKLGVPFIEAMAVMGMVHPFFEKAGMKRYQAKPAARSVRLVEALGIMGIDEQELIDPQAIQDKFDSLAGCEAEFIERQMSDFLGAYGKAQSGRTAGPPGIERTRYVLSKLTARPVYYIWFNPDKQFVDVI